jgi:hypothetical protein
VSRIVLERFLSDTTVLSTLVMVIAIVASLVLCWMVQKTGVGKFLFERPVWAHLPGTKGSRSYAARAEATPAE